MNNFWIKTPFFIKWLFPKYVWSAKDQNKTIYLTFDDGPIPEVTEWILDILKKEKIKATFFCIGENIEKHPNIFERVIDEGHTIGNHTFNHLNGWKTTSEAYIENFNACHSTIQKYTSNYKGPKLFRPPYGKITKTQANRIMQQGYKIIMWDVLSYDFNPKMSPEKCLTNVVKNITCGSIIVFHDSLKAEKNIKFALPKAISLLKEKGFQFETIF
ncbi:Polysaccharide deacetylase family protein [Flavobacterium sp. 9AF]|uniref:polysaccharide deacetylase family protein n=1 Tax=Flavobacterium sp. 9AF TaxID=2653142 RepID=UPI0012F0B119|nr:polysaccharide deacetylase family protein [Flavobacterium sp. 9AF]VXB17505.1 Polysaccharide deacetylase family protein [Flavobacterium sp. 9AF]